MRQFSKRSIVCLLYLLSGACVSHDHDHGHSHTEADGQDTWSVTSWGDHFEIFAEAGMLAAGETIKSHTHVTALADFSPLAEGRVTAIFRSASGSETTFAQDRAVRPGIFSIEITPPVDGEFELVFQVEALGLVERIPSGRVYVGTAAEPGMLITAPEPPYGPAIAAAAGVPPIGFLKEQQWKTAFATAWAAEGAIHATVDGFAKVRPAAGGDVIVAAPTNGIISGASIIHTGLAVREGQELLQLLPRAVAEQSLSELRSELAFERTRLARLEQLVKSGAVSQEEVDLSRSRVEALTPLVEEQSQSGTLPIRASVAGRVAEVWTRPGASVEAGDSLLRLVHSASVWLEVALDAEEAAILGSNPRSLHLRVPGFDAPVSFAADKFRLVGVSPSLDPITGTATVLLEILKNEIALPLGATIEASIGTAVEYTGVVIDAGALVDDGGTDIVYVQTEGESFERHEVHVRRREGGRALVEGIVPGVRIVTHGGAMIRRASMLSSGGIEGHVH